jgi:hypothetical protein
MNPQLEQLERQIGRQLAELTPDLDAPAPRPECIAQLKVRVDAEARRLRRRQRRLVAARPWIGVAAAVLLAIGLSLPPAAGPGELVIGPVQDADAAFVGWLDALDQSEERFAALLEEDWLLNGSVPAGEENGEGIDPLDSLEQSLESFERMIGA